MNLLEKIGGLPAHPVYVHFPVAFLVTSSFLLGLYLWDGPPHRLNRWFKKIRLGQFNFESFSLFFVLLGLVMGVVAVLSGLALVEGWENVPVPHGVFAMATVSCYFVILVLRWVYGPALHSKPLRWLYYGLNLLGILLVGLTGFSGGELHYQ